MFKILISLLLIIGVFYFSGNGVADELQKRTGWFPYSMVKDSTLIIKGNVSEFGYNEIANLEIVPRPNFYRVSVKETIKGHLAVSDIYLIEPPMSTSMEHPPFFLSENDYILFLKPKDDPQGYIRKIGVEERPIFETVGNWKGAISLDPKNLERANKALQQQHGLNAVAEQSRLVNAIRDFTNYLSEPDKEKRKVMLNIFFQKQDTFYQDFINTASQREK